MSPKIKRRLRKVAAVLACLYAVLLVLLFANHLPDLLIINAAPGPMDMPGATRLMLTSPGGDLEACVARSPTAQSADPTLYVLFFVGNEDRVNLWTAGVAAMWEQQTGQPTEAWGVNLPGFGLSAGPPHLRKIGPAALAAFDALHARAGTRPIVVQAASLGTLAAMCVGANRPVAAMTIQDPPPLIPLVLERNGWWNAWLLSIPIALSRPGDIDSIANAHRCTAPCIFITSGADTVIPPPYQQRIIDAYAGPHRHVILPNARHCSPPDPERAAVIAADRQWLFAP